MRNYFSIKVIITWLTAILLASAIIHDSFATTKADSITLVPNTEATEAFKPDTEVLDSIIQEELKSIDIDTDIKENIKNANQLYADANIMLSMEKAKIIATEKKGYVMLVAFLKLQLREDSKTFSLEQQLCNYTKKTSIAFMNHQQAAVKSLFYVNSATFGVLSHSLHRLKEDSPEIVPGETISVALVTQAFSSFNPLKTDYDLVIKPYKLHNTKTVVFQIPKTLISYDESNKLKALDITKSKKGEL